MARLSRQDVIKIVASSHQPFCLQGIYLSSLDLSLLDLSRVNFSYGQSGKGQFSASLIAKANLTRAVLHLAGLRQTLAFTNR